MLWLIRDLLSAIFWLAAVVAAAVSLALCAT